MNNKTKKIILIFLILLITAVGIYFVYQDFLRVHNIEETIRNQTNIEYERQLENILNFEKLK